MFRHYNAVDGALNKYIIHAVDPALLSPIKDHITGFGQVTALEMEKLILRAYRAIEEICLV